ncbi:MAG: N-acetyl-gamma-glutamyl-phosphate reductase [Acidimicrobiales bacterium]|nr:N-acetyl-gamma-glutamyl-phosphate reductase [Acidimicrobiales bacterium]
MKVGIAGASGYAGTELLRLIAGHPDLEVAVATAAGHEGEAIAAHTPSLAAAYPSLHYAATDAGTLDGLDLVFSALPHGASQDLVPELLERVGRVVDLAADFRLRDPALYPTWYGEPHRVPELLGEAVYGLPELEREAIRGARLVAVPGCYPTAAILGIAPLLEAGLMARPDAATPPLVVDAASGVSGAGRGAKEQLHFGTVAEDFVAYGLLDHRHTSEMEQALGVPLLFTPHLAPMVRGILVTAYGRPGPAAGSATSADALAALRSRYAGEPFVVVVDGSPSTKATRGSNAVHVSARIDARTGWVVALAALDNLVKGAAGQALQCANLVLDLPEDRGLSTTGLFP